MGLLKFQAILVINWEHYKFMPLILAVKKILSQINYFDAKIDLFYLLP
jgi:hypothetical protein